MSNLQNAGFFLVNTLFSLYIFILLLRLLLQVFQANYQNPIIQFIAKATDPIIKPLKPYMPRTRLVDTCTLLVIFAFEMLKVTLLLMISQSAMMNTLDLLLYATADLLSTVVNIFFFAILIKVILSWLNPTSDNPTMSIIHTLTEPLLQPVRGLIPPISGLDISPIFVLIVLKLIDILLVNPIYTLI